MKIGKIEIEVSYLLANKYEEATGIVDPVGKYM